MTQGFKKNGETTVASEIAAQSDTEIRTNNKLNATSTEEDTILKLIDIALSDSESGNIDKATREKIVAIAEKMGDDKLRNFAKRMIGDINTTADGTVSVMNAHGEHLAGLEDDSITQEYADRKQEYLDAMDEAAEAARQQFLEVQQSSKAQQTENDYRNQVTNELTTEDDERDKAWEAKLRGEKKESPADQARGGVRKMTLEQVPIIAALQKELQEAIAARDNASDEFHYKGDALDQRVDAINEKIKEVCPATGAENAEKQIAVLKQKRDYLSKGVGMEAEIQNIDGQIKALEPLAQELVQKRGRLAELQQLRDASGDDKVRAHFNEQIKPLAKELDSYSAIKDEIAKKEQELTFAQDVGDDHAEIQRLQHEINTLYGVIDASVPEQTKTEASNAIKVETIEAQTEAPADSSVAELAPVAAIHGDALVEKAPQPVTAEREEAKRKEKSTDELKRDVNLVLNELNGALMREAEQQSEMVTRAVEHHIGTFNLVQGDLSGAQQGDNRNQEVWDNLLILANDLRVSGVIRMEGSPALKKLLDDVRGENGQSPKFDARPVAPPLPPVVKPKEPARRATEAVANVVVAEKPSPEPVGVEAKAKDVRKVVQMADWINEQLIIENLAQSKISPDQITADVIQQEANKQHKTIRVRTESSIKRVNVGDMRAAVVSRRTQSVAPEAVLAASEPVAPPVPDANQPVERPLVVESVSNTEGPVILEFPHDEGAEAREAEARQELQRMEGIYKGVKQLLDKAERIIDTGTPQGRESAESLKNMARYCKAYGERLGADDDAFKDLSHLKVVLDHSKRDMAQDLRVLVQANIIDIGTIPTGDVKDFLTASLKDAVILPKVDAVSTATADNEVKKTVPIEMAHKERVFSTAEIVQSVERQVGREGRRGHIDLARITSVADQIQGLPDAERTAFVQTYKKINASPSFLRLSEHAQELTDKAISYLERRGSI